jgi:RNA polymerase sigma factor (sigma-70 family)
MRIASLRSQEGLEHRKVTAHNRNGTSDRTKAVDAASALFNEHGGFIRAAIRFQARNEFQEDDLFQQFFLSLVKRPVPANIDNVKSYLYRAIANDILDAARRKARRRKHFDKLAEEFRNAIHKQVPSNAIKSEDNGDAAFACLTRQLRKREAEAVTLRYQDDRSIPEIARVMGVDPRTVSHYLAAALRQLRRICAIE